jgi:hypothetical protein
MPSNVDCCNFGGYDADEGDILVDINAFPNEVLPESPHFVSAEVLVLECKFYIFRLAGILIKLGTKILGAGVCIAMVWKSASLRTLVTVISPLFLIPNTSAIFPGMDILGREREGCHTEIPRHARDKKGADARTCN